MDYRKYLKDHDVISEAIIDIDLKDAIQAAKDALKERKFETLQANLRPLGFSFRLSKKKGNILGSMEMVWTKRFPESFLRPKSKEMGIAIADFEAEVHGMPHPFKAKDKMKAAQMHLRNYIRQKGNNGWRDTLVFGE